MVEIGSRERRLNQAIGLRESGQFEAAAAELDRLRSDFGDDAEICYQTGWARDRLGDELGAIPLYEEALRISTGLAAGDKFGLYIGLASSYRLLGQFEESFRILSAATVEYPDNAAFEVFRALTLADSGDQRSALRVLLQLIATSWDRPEIQEYRRPVLEYAAALVVG